jgi:hypothetical protein
MSLWSWFDWCEKARSILGSPMFQTRILKVRRLKCIAFTPEA